LFLFLFQIKFIQFYQRDEYVNYKPYDKFTNHAPNYQTNLTIKLKERYPTYEEMRAKYHLDSKQNTGIIKEPIQIRNIGYVSQEETRKRKLELMKGAKDLIKGIATTNMTSCYQEVYR